MTPAGVLRLDFHGVSVEVSSDASRPLDELARDFSYFARPDGRPERPDVRLELRAIKPPPASLPRRTLLRWRAARIAHEAGVRKTDYEGRALLEYDLRAERGVLYSDEHDLLHELSYLTVLSRVGHRLDRRRLHRVHALGFCYRGQGGLLVLPSEGGKSRLGLELMTRAGFTFLSDDIPLLDGRGGLHAFPLRLGLRGDDWKGVPERFVRPFNRRRFGVKHLVDLAYLGGKVASAAPLRWLLVGDRKQGPPALRPCARTRAAAALLPGLVLGVGTPQVLELMLPSPPFAGGALDLAAIAARRAAAAVQAARRARCALFTLGPDPRANADLLTSWLESA